MPMWLFVLRINLEVILVRVQQVINFIYNHIEIIELSYSHPYNWQLTPTVGKIHAPKDTKLQLDTEMLDLGL